MAESSKRPSESPSRNELAGIRAALSGLADPHGRYGAAARPTTEHTQQLRPGARDEKAQTVSTADSARQSTGSRIAEGPKPGGIIKK